eukprot:TRINITY_DN4725_c0_g1_i2.p1 TRINITY_DN4725_c0_g1~~TRINITY_DN4725_c0_g1_i2.p1  ORF type:complete len:471 (+),score=130.70 TRINITY_DN4725_c0_g1_i2:25-1413(+)
MGGLCTRSHAHPLTPPKRTSSGKSADTAAQSKPPPAAPVTAAPAAAVAPQGEEEAGAPLPSPKGPPPNRLPPLQPQPEATGTTDTTAVVFDKCIVADFGSGMIKLGLAGSELPVVITPSLCGRLKKTNVATVLTAPEELEKIFVGDELQAKRGLLSVTHPIEYGVVQDWDAWGQLVERAMAELEHRAHVAPFSLPVAICVPPVYSRPNAERMASLLLDQYAVPAVCLIPQDAACVAKLQMSDGLVVNIGECQTWVCACRGGRAVSNASQVAQVAGRDVTAALLSLLEQHGYPLRVGSGAHLEIVRDVKHRLARVSVDPAAEAGATDQPYELPDGTTIGVGAEAWRCAECLIGEDGARVRGVARVVADCARLAGVPVTDVALVGGSARLSGLDARLALEIAAATGTGAVRVRVPAPGPEDARCDVITWQGASAIAEAWRAQLPWLTAEQLGAGGRVEQHTANM